MARLSSGLRINSAKDDAAGLAISDRMTSQIRGLNQAARNANDGISLAQTAEGALQESTSLLQRIRELAVQSANDTNTESDRNSLNAEVNQLKQEMSRISSSTTFNGKNLLDGTFTSARFQIGANANQTIELSIASAKTEDLSKVGAIIAAPNGTPVVGATVSGVAQGSGSLIVNGSTVSANDGSQTGLASAINIAAGSTIATAKNVQSFDFSSVSLNPPSGPASPGQTESATFVSLGVLLEGQELSIGGRTVRAAGGSLTAPQVQAAFADPTSYSWGVMNSTIPNAEMFLDLSGWTTADGLTFTSTTPTTDVSNISVSTGDPGDPSTHAPVSHTDGDGVSVHETTNFSCFWTVWAGQSRTVAGLTVTATGGSIGPVEFRNALVSGTSSGTAVVSGTLDPNWSVTADGLWNAVFTYTLDASDRPDLVMTPGHVSAPTVPIATVTEGFDPVSSGDGTYTMTFDGSTTLDIELTSGTTVTADEIVEAINSPTIGAPGYTASLLSSGKVQIAKNDGSTFTLSEAISVDGTTPSATSAGLAGVGSTSTTFYGQLSLDSTEDIIFDGSGIAAAGLSRIGNRTTTIDALDVSTREAAAEAISSVDLALSQIDSSRGELGAIQNRFESAISNLSNVAENLSAARSRILDADISQETSAMTKSNILQQAGVAILAQANQAPQLALSLLK